MFNWFKTKELIVFKDDDQFGDIYNIIAKADIEFKTDDNKEFTAFVDNKLWIFVWYSTWGDDVTMHSNIRIITEPNNEGQFVSQISLATSFNEDNIKKVNKLLDVKIDQWRIKNLDRVEAERKEKIKGILQK